jgi:hypothetical protein
LLKQQIRKQTNFATFPLYLVALQNATIVFGRRRRPKKSYYRSRDYQILLEYLLADNARHLTTRRAFPFLKPFFAPLIPKTESNYRVFVPVTTGRLEEHALAPQFEAEVALRL